MQEIKCNYQLQHTWDLDVPQVKNFFSNLVLLEKVSSGSPQLYHMFGRRAFQHGPGRRFS